MLYGMNRDQARIGNDFIIDQDIALVIDYRMGVYLLPAEPRLSHASGMEMMISIGKTCTVSYSKSGR